MRTAATLLSCLFGALALGQSFHVPFGPAPVAYSELHSWYAPFSRATGVSVLRSQKDLNAFWAANNGSVGSANESAPWPVDFKCTQVVAIVFPPSFGFDAVPTVAGIENLGCHWRVHVAPKPGWTGQRMGQFVPFTLVRTPIGPNQLEIVLYDPKGKETTRFAAGAQCLCAAPRWRGHQG